MIWFYFGPPRMPLSAVAWSGQTLIGHRVTGLYGMSGRGWFLGIVRHGPAEIGDRRHPDREESK